MRGLRVVILVRSVSYFDREVSVNVLSERQSQQE